MRSANFFMTAAAKKLLLDVREAGESILENTAGKSLAEYSLNRLLRRAIEREFEIVGEALKRLAQGDPVTAASVSQLRRIVDFRNRIIHGYGSIDDTVEWGVAEQSLPLPNAKATVLLAAEDGE